MNKNGLCGLIFLAANALASADGGLPTETFTDSSGGWQDRDPGKLIVSHVASGGNPGGCLRLIFPSQSVSFPDTDAVVAAGQGASMNFMGDYLGAEAMMLGFDFMAEQVLPSSLWIKVYSGSKVIFRDVTSRLRDLNAWQSVRVSLLAADLGGWQGDVETFFDVLQDVVKVEIQITRHGEATQRYYLDNLFLDRVPAGSPLPPDQESGLGMTWRDLRIGDTYLMEGASDLSQPAWTPLGSFVAADDVWETRFSSTNGMMFYRLSHE